GLCIRPAGPRSGTRGDEHIRFLVGEDNSHLLLEVFSRDLDFKKVPGAPVVKVCLFVLAEPGAGARHNISSPLCEILAKLLVGCVRSLWTILVLHREKALVLVDREC